MRRARKNILPIASDIDKRIPSTRGFSVSHSVTVQRRIKERERAEKKIVV
jgi:hypothetical protein